MTRISFAGTHDPSFSRSVIVAEGLRRRGFTVDSIVEPSWGSTAERVRSARRGLANPALAMRLAAAYARLTRRLAALPEGEPLYLGYPGQLDAIALRFLAPGRKLVLDAFVAIDETLRDRNLGAPNGAARRTARILDWAAVRFADLAVVDTTAHRRRFASDYGLREAKAVVVPVGAMDPWEGSPDGTASREKNRGGRLRVVYFGGFIPLHGVPVILAAARLLAPEDSIDIELVGEGQGANEIAASLAREPLPHVTMHRGWMSEAQLVADYVASADVCLGIFAGSPKAMDVVPAKVFLALACGRPIVTAESPAVREEIMARSRPAAPLLTCPPDDPRALADALLQLRDGPDQRAALGAAARALYLRRFRPELVVDTLVPALELL